MKKFFLFVALLCLFTAVETQAVNISTESRTVTQNFDEMWDAGNNSAILAMPADWRVERQMNSPRTVGTWAGAQTTLMYSGGVSLASNASNGTWNFGSSATPSDRAVGGLSTTVSGGTRCLSVMCHLTNTATVALEKLTLSYDIEKYRNGSNAEGFAVQVYYSTDGSNWVSAGDDLRTYFAPDGATQGAATVPISTTSVADKTVKLNVAAGSDVYLAWNISVAAGTSPNQAMGLALDNISISGTWAGEESLCNIYVEDVTKWASLMLNTGSGNITPAGTATVNGVAYKYFELPGNGATLNLTFTNGATSTVTGPTIIANKDYYYCLTSSEVTEISDPESYTGWVDPTRPPFVSSGIYLRGEVNSWGASSEWEFSNEGSGTYVLYDKTLSGNFKVADASWSSACNYGSNGSTILIDTPYGLVSGTNDNISCGSNTYLCSRIILTIADGTATLLLESNDDPSGLTTVYVMGDHNGWNYTDTSGALELTATPGVFTGQVTLTPSENGLSYWRIYQRLGMSGVWGNPGGADATSSTLAGTLEKGSKGAVCTAPGTYEVSFDINTGAYTLTQIESQPVNMEVEPADVVLVPELPAKVKILSLNNSLIYYNDQDAVFNGIAEAMGKDAQWTKHTLLGKPLSTHWAEGDGLAEDGNPGAKMLIRSQPWSHIILQEQSSLPRTSVETFRANVKQWQAYIRDYCPNPNAVIIIPVNWAYSGDWENYTNFNKTFVANYLDVARELGVTLCPVGVAYQDVYEREGSTGTLTWFQDDRHPTLKATYMAAAMEYGLIFGEDPSTISWKPAGMTDAEATAMRGYASRALSGFDNVVDHNAGIINFSVVLRDQFGMAIDSPTPIETTVGGGSISNEYVFTSNGTNGDYTLQVTNGTFSKTSEIHVVSPVTEMVELPAIEINESKMTVSENFDAMSDAATATMPEGWRIDRMITAPRTVGRYDRADSETMYAGGVSLASNAKNGTWNFGADDTADRAVGGISTGVADATRCVNVYTHLLNTGRKNIQNIVLEYDVEKYRKGANSAGFDVQLYYSIDGRNWTSAGNDFKTHFNADAATEGYASVPGETVHVSATLPAVAQAGCDLFLAWNITVASGTAANAAMALAIDNFSFSGELPPIPTAKHYVYAQDLTEWDALGLYAWGDSEILGAWPGESWVEEVDVNGTMFKKFLLDTESGNYHLIFNNWNNGLQTPDYDITGDRDYYLKVEAGKVTPMDPFSGVEELNADNAVTIKGTDVVATGTILVFDITGRIMLTGNDELSIAELPSGIYVIRTGMGTVKVAR